LVVPPFVKKTFATFNPTLTVAAAPIPLPPLKTT